jgi:hypothetical protein
MQFLADVELVCDDCKGTRFKPTVLDVKYRGLNIHEVLQLTVKEAISFFSATPRLVHKLQVLDEQAIDVLRVLAGEIQVAAPLGLHAEHEGQEDDCNGKKISARPFLLHRILPEAVIRPQCPPRSS